MTGTKTDNVYLASKPRYEILDGLRGVAAVFVLIYHLCETHFGLGAVHPLNHGYLAVDFFFVLSGFVIGYAYDDRWNRMTTWTFFKRRLIRLHPMVICGSLIGALLFYFQQCHGGAIFGHQPFSWRNLLPALYHPLPTHPPSGAVDGQPSRCSCVHPCVRSHQRVRCLHSAGLRHLQAL